MFVLSIFSDIFDVYRKEENQVYLVDFNPYGQVTDSLLFKWEELLCDKPLDIDVKSDADIVRV
jgi:hypothetical protein